MVRRSTRKAPVIPPGWTVHDGTGCPLGPDDHPAVIHRMGTRIRFGAISCAEYARYASDPWVWHPERPGSADIIAYSCEAPDE